MQGLSRAVRTGHCERHSFIGLPGVRADSMAWDTQEVKMLKLQSTRSAGYSAVEYVLSIFLLYSPSLTDIMTIIV